MKGSIKTIDFHGLPAVRVALGGCSAVISLYGGQVLSWTPGDGKERLFLSDRASFDGTVPVRGGIPVCFPQFSSLGTLPKHGLVRTATWEVTSERSGDDFALVALAIRDSDRTRPLWPYPFLAEVTLLLEADRLEVELSIDNTGTETFSFTAALHTYLRVEQVEQVALVGLEGLTYRDAANGDRIVRDKQEQLVPDAETDRVYHDVTAPLVLRASKLSLGVAQEGFTDVVVWNPWVDGCAKLADMPANGWRHMLCVEAAVAQTPVVLPAGEQWVGRQTLFPV